ncbi:MAG TPA: penicillin-binding transpeptidase domain-containing protein, partial [Gemmatimonadaceae bacterium]|nr:penicillin-binding transpeptidase domain-containing protein [Gemmatimonadaceae bacterium]
PHFTTRVLAALDSARDASSLEEAATQSQSTLARATGEPATALTSPRLRTTLDLALQEAVETDVRQVVASLAGARVRHAAAVVLDNASGDVLAWVGSPDFDGERGQVDMVVSRRQPGSALKPLLYALAFERGYGAYDVLADVPRTWMTSTGPYAPRNYDRRFRGPVRARVALASSLNVPAVQLADALGASSFLAVLHRAGFASLTRSADHYGLGLALGNGEVTLLELANAYRALANGGERSAVRRFADVPSERATTRVVRADVAALTLDILADADARLAGFGEAPVFHFPFPVAVKTGTSRHFTDNWAVGVTGRFTVAVWVGNFDGTPMAAVSGISGAGPLLRRAILSTAAHYQPGLLPSLEALGASRVRVCRVSGLGAVPACDAIDEWRLADAPEPAPDDWHRHGAVVLPAQYAEWEASEQALPSTLARTIAASRRTDDDHAPLALLSPRDGDEYLLPAGPERSVATVPLRATGRGADAALTWSVDGAPVTSTRWAPAPGTHVVRVESVHGEVREARVVVRELPQ